MKKALRGDAYTARLTKAVVTRRTFGTAHSSYNNEQEVGLCRDRQWNWWVR